MSANILKPSAYPLPEDERRRRKREIILIFVILAVVAILTFAETRIITFGADFPISNTILMFILININLLLLILLIFLVFRNLVKLYYDRRRKVMGARLRSRLVLAFVGLSLLPTIILFFFSINFITSSIEFWFNVPVEQALENSLFVGRRFYSHIQDQDRFFLDRIAYQIRTRKLLEDGKDKALANYVQVVQREFNFDAVEVYTPNAARMTFSAREDLFSEELSPLPADRFVKGTGEEGVRTITQEHPDGELVRTIGAVPFGAEIEQVEAWLVSDTLLPPALSEKLDSISRGFEGYQKIKLLKEPIRITYYITLSIVALLVMFCAIWFGFYLAKSITIPLRELADSTRRVAEGDLSFTIPLSADDEIGQLVDAFNRMTRDLRFGREQIEYTTSKLKEQNAELEQRRQYMEVVLENISAGVISIDAGGFITTMNKSAERMLGLKAEDVTRKYYQRLLHGRQLDLARDVADRLGISDSVQMPLRIAIAGRPKSFMAHFNALRDHRGRHMGIVMVFDDLTELEKAQRMAAWREVARRIAHEVKNPLTPITLSAQRLRRKFAERLEDAVFDECTRTIIDQVEVIRNLVNEFSAFARFPTANPKPCALTPIIEETVALYREGGHDVTFTVRSDDGGTQLNLDRQQIKQAFINLFDNAIAAMKQHGDVTVTQTHDPILNMVRVEVADTGPGISDEDKTRLFEPYFSTKKAGMGLGLTIVSTIIADHNGMVSVQDNPGGGARFVIELPVLTSGKA